MKPTTDPPILRAFVQIDTTITDQNLCFIAGDHAELTSKWAQI